MKEVTAPSWSHCFAFCDVFLGLQVAPNRLCETRLKNSAAVVKPIIGVDKTAFVLLFWLSNVFNTYALMALIHHAIQIHISRYLLVYKVGVPVHLSTAYSLVLSVMTIKS